MCVVGQEQALSDVALGHTSSVGKVWNKTEGENGSSLLLASIHPSIRPACRLSFPHVVSLRVALWGAAAAAAAAAPVVVFDIEPKGRRAQASGLDGAGGPVTAATRPSELGRIGGRGGRWRALVGRGEMWRRNRICQREWFAVARPIGGPQRRPLSSASTCAYSYGLPRGHRCLLPAREPRLRRPAASVGSVG